MRAALLAIATLALLQVACGSGEPASAEEYAAALCGAEDIEGNRNAPTNGEMRAFLQDYQRSLPEPPPVYRDYAAIGDTLWDIVLDWLGEQDDDVRFYPRLLDVDAEAAPRILVLMETLQDAVRAMPQYGRETLERHGCNPGALW